MGATPPPQRCASAAVQQSTGEYRAKSIIESARRVCVRSAGEEGHTATARHAPIQRITLRVHSTPVLETTGINQPHGMLDDLKFESKKPILRVSAPSCTLRLPLARLEEPGA